MFITCPKCQEQLKEDIEKCPFCGHEFDINEIKENIRNREREKSRFESEMVKEAGHRRVVSIIVCVIALIVLLASEKLMDLLDIDDMIACIFLIVFVVAFLVFICFSKYNKCPYCDKHMYRRGAWAVNNCPHCGGRIR